MSDPITVPVHRQTAKLIAAAYDDHDDVSVAKYDSYSDDGDADDGVGGRAGEGDSVRGTRFGVIDSQ